MRGLKAGRSIGPVAILAMAAILMLMLGGCGVRYYSPDKLDKDWQPDYENCERSVRDEVRKSPDGMTELEEGKLITNCMRQKGWKQQRTFFGVTVGEPKE